VGFANRYEQANTATAESVSMQGSPHAGRFGMEFVAHADLRLGPSRHLLTVVRWYSAHL
jgi:hypothetical protein